MKYIANPVEVDAFEIVSVAPATVDGTLSCAINDGTTVQATAEMMSRMIPKSGDYWVVQSDGYIYLNPKAVFERKYHVA